MERIVVPVGIVILFTFALSWLFGGAIRRFRERLLANSDAQVSQYQHQAEILELQTKLLERIAVALENIGKRET